MTTIKNTSKARTGGESNPHTLPVGIQSSSTTMKNNVEAPQKTKNKTTI
jgi:hypothetical protein